MLLYQLQAGGVCRPKCLQRAPGGVEYAEAVDHPEHPVSDEPPSRRAVLGMGLIAVLAAASGATFIPSGPAVAAWGGHTNGYIPTSALSPIPWAPSRYLRADAVEALIALNSSFRQAFGYDLPINDAYRSFAGQVDASYAHCGHPNGCSLAATPGTSNHGWAVAIDINVPRLGWSDPKYVWMKANAAEYGWYHPSWAEPYGSGPEAWHWEFTGSYTPPNPETAPAGDREQIMYIRRESTGEIAVFGGSFRNSTGGATGRHIFATQQEYDRWKNLIGFYNSHNSSLGLPGQNQLPVPPPQPSQVMGVSDADWTVICGIFGV